MLMISLYDALHFLKSLRVYSDTPERQAGGAGGVPLYRKCQLINRKNERMGEGSVLPLEKVIIDQGSPSDAATPGGRSRGTGDSPAQGICLQITCWFSGEEDSGQRTELGLLL